MFELLPAAADVVSVVFQATENREIYLITIRPFYCLAEREMNSRKTRSRREVSFDCN